MKAIAVNTYVVDVGSFRPVVVEILTDEGISGVGEGAVGFGIGALGHQGSGARRAGL